MEQPKRLLRSTTNKVIAGVCGGLGDYFNIDPTILRILFVALVVWGGSGVLLYIVLWLVIPEAGKESLPVDQRVQQAGQEIGSKAQDMAKSLQTNRLSGGVIVGAVLIVIGASSVIQAYVPWRVFRWEIFWPVILIAFGLALIIKRK